LRLSAAGAALARRIFLIHLLAHRIADQLFEFRERKGRRGGLGGAFPRGSADQVAQRPLGALGGVWAAIARKSVGGTPSRSARAIRCRTRRSSEPSSMR
jgi:hypothetical protein